MSRLRTPLLPLSLSSFHRQMVKQYPLRRPLQPLSSPLQSVDIQRFYQPPFKSLVFALQKLRKRPAKAKKMQHKKQENGKPV